MGGKLSPRFIPPSPFSAVFSLCVGVDGVFSFLCCGGSEVALHLSGTDAAYSSAAGHKKTQAFPIVLFKPPEFRCHRDERSTWKRLCAADECR